MIMLKVIIFLTPFAMPSVFFISFLLGNCLGRGMFISSPPYSSSKVSLEKKVLAFKLMPNLSGAPLLLETAKGLLKSILNLRPFSVNSVQCQSNPDSLSFLSVPSSPP